MGLFITTVSTPTPPGTATLSSASVTTTSSVVLAANLNRMKFSIWNAGSKAVFLAFAGTASSTSFSINLPANALYESDLNDYTGDVSAITASGTATLKITEETA